MNKSRDDLKEFFEFKKKLLVNMFRVKTKKNSVLIVEPNSYHGEILPGYVNYFQRLGFNVDLLLRKELSHDLPFADSSNMKCYFVTAAQMKIFLSRKSISHYDYVFLSSSAFWDSSVNYFGSYLDYLGFEPKARYGILLIEHNIIPCLKDYEEEKYLVQNRLFTLSGFQNTPMLNPHYFCDTSLSKKNKFVSFITVGGLSKQYRNHEMIFSSVEKLEKRGITNFKIVVIGRGDELQIPAQYLKYIEFKGQVSFSVMYDEIKKADFFLALLDPRVEEHVRYKTGTTSGSRQLVLGFLKPCLIERSFASVYDFDECNSLVYDGDCLFEAMIRAIEMSDSFYEELQTHLLQLSNKISSISLENLKKSIEYIKNSYN